MKKTLIFLLFLMAGLIMGAVLTRVAQQVSFLNWLCWGDSVGFGYPEAVTLNLSVIRLNLGMYVELNVARLICLAAALGAYLRWGRKL
ncbi:MAG TPA: DUF4321 domain-containing protein [Candidatus Faecivivens stercoripullorum]|uniref:DUF4321 domain-containing protein n=1 Tax=Candidatus Faecivivens stercoripullorum TaxID=2840805 RepID=A0A9D1KRL8_9FIRM|nr:DUF4321 domain-containing protein [Candidatus Faecivivens stercoripullorum]